MKRFLNVLWAALSSRALTPVVIGFFFLAYIVIAFFTEEALITLIGLTGHSLLLGMVVALLPLNAACRIVAEALRFRKGRRLLTRPETEPDPALFDEVVALDPSPAPSLADFQKRLAAAGYRSRMVGERLAAWRGVSLAPVRVVFLAAVFCLFAGILISVQGRVVSRQSIIEGEPLPTVTGNGGVVERITLQDGTGSILRKELIIKVGAGGQGGAREFGIYPPGLMDGAFVYPRYLGVAMEYQFSAPDLPLFRRAVVLPLYPPGREATEELSGSPYRITYVVERPEDGSDPYATGKFNLGFKLIKGGDVVLTGRVPGGGEFVRDGYRLAIPDARRMVVTDYVRDYGVILIWWAGFLFLFGILAWLPMRLLAPRREMFFTPDGGSVRGWSRSEGRGRKHAAIFHEILDLIATPRSAATQVEE
ncbi:hypothetical protein [Geomesophilobacter sediminis]|uniref:ResB-like domain-containing protein n=1 Tax=Geomesophilobacter sediminis TaxID=2798584 RepID=A0A8J7SCN5_9BACT|nr:hypothetical protein [Geomesophilobacter sediminis]MBJ6727289.1 hypothetical protein [Geomesophilobacter sediminis]